MKLTEIHFPCSSSIQSFISKIHAARRLISMNNPNTQGRSSNNTYIHKQNSALQVFNQH